MCDTESSTPTPNGPARAWATEHYGFADDASSATLHGSATRGPTRHTASVRTARRPRIAGRIVAGGVLALALVAGAGGAAIAAADGPGDGPGGDDFALFDDGPGGR